MPHTGRRKHNSSSTRCARVWPLITSPPGCSSVASPVAGSSLGVVFTSPPRPPADMWGGPGGSVGWGGGRGRGARLCKQYQHWCLGGGSDNPHGDVSPVLGPVMELVSLSSAAGDGNPGPVAA